MYDNKFNSIKIGKVNEDGTIDKLRSNTFYKGKYNYKSNDKQVHNIYVKAKHINNVIIIIETKITTLSIFWAMFLSKLGLEIICSNDVKKNEFYIKNVDNFNKFYLTIKLWQYLYHSNKTIIPNVLWLTKFGSKFTPFEILVLAHKSKSYKYDKHKHICNKTVKPKSKITKKDYIKYKTPESVFKNFNIKHSTNEKLCFAIDSKNMIKLNNLIQK